MKSFEHILDESLKLLQRQGKISYRALKRQFDIDDAFVEDIVFELTEVKQIARDERGIMLVLIEADNRSDVEQVSEVEQEQNAEKRQLTVMFVDLVGSTRLSNQLDPEDFANILYKYQDLFDSVIKKYGGAVVQLLGDGIMSYFGHPIAHEDDPIRAILSGMEMLKSLKNLNVRIHKEFNIEIHVRIGVHTGLVVIGGPMVKGNSKMLALGEAPNLAARIQGVAKPDSLMISPVTNRLVMGMFKTESTGHHALKGIDKPMELFKVLAEKVDHRGDIDLEAANFGFVGRKYEKATIYEKWEKARSGQGQVVLVNGIAGIGKSRLVENALLEIAKKEDVPLLKFYCSPYNQNSSYYSLIVQIRKLIGLDDKLAENNRVERLNEFLKKYGLVEPHDLGLLVDLLGLENVDVPPLAVSSEVKRNLTKVFLLRMFLSEHKSMILLIEDVHWSDPSTLELLEEMVMTIQHHSVFCVITHRPEFVHKWKDQSHIHNIMITALRREEAQAMIQHLCSTMPSRLLDELLEKTDGNPLFVEELTKLVLERGMLDTRQEKDLLLTPQLSISIPSTLQDSLMARLDRLGDQAKRVAQMGAAIGREFSYHMISSISSLPKNILEHHLSKLVKAEMLFVSGSGSDSQYSFKHALTQDTAYGSLLKNDRQEFHHKIVKVLEGQPKHLGVRPELFAHHYAAAGLLKESIPYWKQAGEIAVARSAHKEAINHLGKGLQLVQQLPDSTEKVKDELFFHLAIGVPYTVLMGYGSPEVEKAYQRAKDLSEKLEDPKQFITALYGLWRHYLLRGKYTDAKELSDRLLLLTADSDDIMYVNIAYRSAGSTAFYTGQLEDAKNYLEKIVYVKVSYDKHNESLLYDVIDMWVAAYSYLSWTYWLLGETENAVNSIQSAMDLAYKLNHPFSIAFSLCFGSWLYQFMGDFEQTVALGQKGYLVAEEHGFKFWHGWAHLLMHWVGDYEGKKGQLELIEDDLKDWFSTGSRLGTSYFLYLRAERYLHHNFFDRTKKYLDEASAFMDQTGEEFWAPELFRLRGDYHLSIEEEDLALDLYHQAYKKAVEMKSKSLQLRSLNSIIKCDLDKDSQQKFVTELETLLVYFQEQHDNVDRLKSIKIIENLQRSF